jgi:eukaryotic-like serine/threonine-protein kinase
MSEPKNPGGLKPHKPFQVGDFRYEVVRPLVVHPDYDTLLLATREPLQGGSVKLVVLKPVVMEHGRESRHRALEEVSLSKALRHPNIATVYGYVVHDELPYIVMEHLRGCFLLTLMDAAWLVGRKLSPDFAAYVAAEVADALDYAHRCEDDEGNPLKLVHRAVGPMRIRLGDNGRVKLTNFGAAYSELLGRIPTRRGLLRGDPAYIAPEILLGFVKPEARQRDPLTPRKLDGRADIFSLGLVLLEMLLSRYPLDPPDKLWEDLEERFPADVRAERSTLLPLETLANRVLHFGPEEVESAAKELPGPLQKVVERALRPSPAERYQSADDMRYDLRDFLHARPGRPYGAKEAEAELSEILKEASDLRKLAAHPDVEQGVLPEPPDLKSDEPGGVH